MYKVVCDRGLRCAALLLYQPVLDDPVGYIALAVFFFEAVWE